MDFDFLGLPLRLPLFARILEFAHQFFLFGIDGDHRLVPSLTGDYLPIDMLELSVTIRMQMPSLVLRLACKL